MRLLAPILTTLALLVQVSCAALHEASATKAPVRLELEDQFNAMQRIEFPATNLVILTIADRKGSSQVDGWVVALKDRYARRIDLRGLADVQAVPSWLRGAVRRRFQETHAHPVMMDWSGEACARFAFVPGTANVLVIAPDGTIAARFAGPARGAELARAFAAIDAELTKRGSWPTVSRSRSSASFSN